MARQQQIMQQRAMQAQIQASGGMPQGMQQAMQGMNPQQLQQMQQNNPGMHPGQVQLPAHLMQQQQQLLLQRQAQAHAQQQNHLQQQQMAMQQQGSQHSNPGGQPGPPNQQGAQGQQPGQMRPQSRMANPNEQVQTPGQTAPQGQQGQQGQPQGQQSQAGGQPQNPQQPAQQPQMTQQQQQQQQQLMLQQRQRMMHLQQQQQQQQQQNAMARQSMSQPQVNINGQAILFFLNMCDYLCQFGRHNGRDIDLWRMFVDKHFAPDAELTHAFTFGNEGQSKEFRVLRPSIARYFHQYFASGAESIRIHTEYVKEERIPPHNRLRMTSGSATLRVMYENGARLEMRGSITADFGTGMIPEAIENLTFWTSASEEVIERSEIARLLSTFSPTMSTKASPKMSKKNPPKGQQKGSQYDGLTIDHFPKARKGTWGGPEQVQTFLEVSASHHASSKSRLTIRTARRNLQRNGRPDGLRTRKETPSRLRAGINQPTIRQRRPTRRRRPQPTGRTRQPTAEPPTQRRAYGQPHTKHAEHEQPSIQQPGHAEPEPPHAAERHPHEWLTAHLQYAWPPTRRDASGPYAESRSSEHAGAGDVAAALAAGHEFECGERKYEPEC